MLDTNFVAEKKESTTYDPLPNDMYQVELIDITAKLNESYDSKQARKKDATLEPQMETVLDFTFGVLENGQVNGKSIRARRIYINYVPSYLYIGKNGKNMLYMIVEALQNETMSPKQEAEGISGAYLNSLIGKQCRVVTKTVDKNGKTYMDVDNVLPSKADLAPLNATEKAVTATKDDHAAADAAYEGTDDAQPTD